MRLWILRIERFRGIATLDWRPDERIQCLVGAGDMGKTTVLEAVSLLGTPRNRTFDDNDFHGADPRAGPIVIQGTFGELPAALLADNRFGLDLVGVDGDGNLQEEPGDNDPAVTIRLDVDQTLEPVWRVISTRNPEGRPLTGRDRAALAISRLGDDPDRQFSLARGTALARTVTSSDDVAEVLAAAYRQAREAVRGTDLSALNGAIRSARSTATKVGAGAVADNLEVNLETSPATASGLTLHATGIPVRSAGLGTRRLLALGLELGSSDAGAVLCIDEIEHGLEPHRIRHLVSTLDTLVQAGGQVLFTSHSSVVLGELGSRGVSVVRSEDGVVDVRAVPADLADIVRGAPEALLARKVVVGEGKTEVGIVRAFGPAWTTRHEGKALAQVGVAVVEGGGHLAPRRALQLARLGYPTLLLADSDVPMDPDQAALAAAGVTVVQWAGSMCTEERALTDMSWEGVTKAFEAVVENGHDSSSMISAIVGSGPAKGALEELGVARAEIGNTLDALLNAGVSEATVRKGFAAAAAHKEHRWFKRIDSGEALGRIAAEDPDTPASPFGGSLGEVEVWCHG